MASSIEERGSCDLSDSDQQQNGIPFDLISATKINHIGHGDNMSIRSRQLDLSQVKEIFYDEQGHELKLLTEQAYSVFPNYNKELCVCCLCLDDIDKVLGYFFCPICKVESCLTCVQNSKNADMQLAENVSSVGTPFECIQYNSFCEQQRNFASSLLMSEVDDSALGRSVNR